MAHLLKALNHSLLPVELSTKCLSLNKATSKILQSHLQSCFSVYWSPNLLCALYFPPFQFLQLFPILGLFPLSLQIQIISISHTYFKYHLPCHPLMKLFFIFWWDKLCFFSFILPFSLFIFSFLHLYGTVLNSNNLCYICLIHNRFSVNTDNNKLNYTLLTVDD